MNRLLIILLVIICFAHAIEFSQRIQALGTDFAYLIPDYETDLYRNPQLLDRGLTGITYEPSNLYQYRVPLIYDRYIYIPNPCIPFTLILSSKRFG
ncbi:unnamed protein product, partial [marine sediment metagenome]